jgi:hypothetical protein
VRHGVASPRRPRSQFFNGSLRRGNRASAVLGTTAQVHKRRQKPCRFGVVVRARVPYAGGRENMSVRPTPRRASLLCANQRFDPAITVNNSRVGVCKAAQTLKQPHGQIMTEKNMVQNDIHQSEYKWVQVFALFRCALLNLRDFFYPPLTPRNINHICYTFISGSP